LEGNFEKAQAFGKNSYTMKKASDKQKHCLIQGWLSEIRSNLHTGQYASSVPFDNHQGQELVETLTP